MTLKTTLLGLSLTALAGCSTLNADTVFSTRNDPTAEVTMAWDHLPEGSVWTDRTLAALQEHGSELTALTPADIDTWCPGYREADLDGRMAFWTGLLSTLAYHESTWRQAAVGGGGLWYGLVQIAPATARAYDCEARSGDALKDGELNLSCAVRIMNVTVPRDGVVSQGMRGVAADWGPFHSSRKRADMIEFVSQQPYCSLS